MMKYLVLLLALFVAACAPLQSVGSSQTSLVSPFTSVNGTFNGAAFAFDNGTTSALNVKYATEYGIFYVCNNINVTLTYQISPDGVVWFTGPTALTNCAANRTYIALSGAGNQYMRLNLSYTNFSNQALSASNFTAYLAYK